MTNDRPVCIISVVDFNVYWPIIGHLNCMTSFFLLGTKSCLFRMTQAADVAAVGNEKCYAVDGPGEYGWCKASHFFYHNTKRETLESIK